MSAALRTPICDLLHIEDPVVLAGMLTGRRSAAEVPASTVEEAVEILGGMPRLIESPVTT